MHFLRSFRHKETEKEKTGKDKLVRLDKERQGSKKARVGKTWREKDRKGEKRKSRRETRRDNKGKKGMEVDTPGGSAPAPQWGLAASPTSCPSSRLTSGSLVMKGTTGG